MRGSSLLLIPQFLLTIPAILLTIPPMLPNDFLKAFPQFRGTDHVLLKKFLEASREQTVPEATQLYREGDACSVIAFVLSGEIRIYKIGQSGREITLYEIGAGETCILNASCILSGTHYPAFAVTLAQTELMLCPSSEFTRVVTEWEQMRRFVFSVMSRRLTSVMELVEDVAFGRMDERLMEYLLEKSENGKLESTHQKIANDIGTSREVVSRLLKDFEHRNKIKLSRNSITLLE